MDAAEVAEDGDAGHILAVESQNAGGLLAQTGSAVWMGDGLVCMFMLAIIGCSDLGQEAGDHFDDIHDGHSANLILLAHLLFAPQ